ncbi:MAG TPA: enoyl-[acyl-carrier-protein] reductase FabK [Synergistaceae bacterium]|jgi:enoyl-[acyl-carrier protein] reductase II|nr:enoyl-[acyl-carrier-protein] reductase FabK [Synergistaceae bacterium]NLL41279.1 enoyl-[acyl-carrier-protein] reductase FabK [Synergistaceae bacterium]HPX03169.1 enoyl-[acyl-carrier-protein] reductase FabK [Synergistaceae bacterium]HQA53971.1 enoyl-[acyl-carrier-protein] reductase FabK [Synergistaceae bacterium]
MFENNRVTQLLKIKYPVIQGGMAWVADADLAAAVSNAGGLGIIAAASMPPELLEEQIVKIRKLTDKPFGMNIMLLSPTADDALEIAAQYRVPVVTTGAGMPGKVLDRLKPLGTVVVPVIASTAHAERVAKQGADAVVAEGTEAGGHIGEITTMNLVPQVADVISIPVIAAGGVADGRGMAAAFALGAEGVQVGTRFVCAAESNVHINYKEKIVEANDRATVVTGRSTGHPVRGLKNKLSREFEELEKKGASIEEIEKLGTGKLRLAVVEGDTQWGSLMAGQSAGLVKKIEPAAAIIEDLINGATAEIERLKRFAD